MIFLRKILFPFAILYGFITSIRNWCYDSGIFKADVFDFPIIAVGNLSVGGTGKTPQIEYLIRLLQDSFQVATLSRGYKRKSKGFLLASKKDTPETLGDEPFQIYQKFPKIQVAVDANRKNGIENLLAQKNKPTVILLDDAFQHRKVKAGLYILLTAYDDLYVDDYLLPTGNLREARSGAKRAHVVVVTKCPPTISKEEMLQLQLKLRLNKSQELYFSTIAYDDSVFSEELTLKVAAIENEPKVLLTGIAKPASFYHYLKKENDIVLTFPDHHHFSSTDIQEIKNKMETKKLITTEKDFVRLKGKLPPKQLFYLPIQSLFLSKTSIFNQTILDFVRKHN